MMDKIAIYPIIITKNSDEGEYPYYVEIPDLDGETEGKTLTDAILMAQDYIGTYSLANALPPSNVDLPKVENPRAITNLVSVNISQYKRKHDHKAVKKTLTIPNYLNELGKERGINFSEVLTEALKEKLSI